MSAPVQHRPLGGHPYRIEPDQRWPVHPRRGEPWEVRALVEPAVGLLWIELECEGEASRVPMQRVDAASLYDAGDATDGHLMDASRAVPDLGGRALWVARLGSARGEQVRYRFVADEVPGAWYRVCPVAWEDGPPPNVVGDSSRLLAGTSWLVGADGPVAVRCSLALAAGEHVSGFGERFDHLDQRGHRFDATVFEQYQRQGSRTYLPSPFAVVASGGQHPGWGVHVRTARRVWFDVGSSDDRTLAIEASVDPADPALELRVYDGDPAEVIAAHLAETGPAVAPPEWVFTPWMSGNEWNTQERVEREVQASIDAGIPVGVVVIEAWSDESTFVAFRDARYAVHDDGAPHTLAEFDFPAEGAWPDPKGMVDRLHDLGVRVLLWQIPLVPTDRGDSGQVAADAATMVRRGYCVHDGTGSAYRNRGWWFPGALLPDWTNPEARAWWLAKRAYLLDEVGVDGFKTDGGEHAWGDDLRYADGSDGAAANNLFAQRYAAAYHELFDQRGRTEVTFSRAGFTGAATTPCHWAGDESSTWEGFRASVIAGQTAGLSGVIFWGWDLAGFSGEIPGLELWARATAMAALCPVMQYHSEFNHHRSPSRDRTPWNLAARLGDERALTIYRWWAKLRMRLQPYLVAQARRCVARGEPLMRAMCIDHPRDQQVWNVPLQYQLGTDLLVAPVCHPGVDSTVVYLPRDDDGEPWTDVWTGERHRGGAIEVLTPLERIPVFARGSQAGSLAALFSAAET